jgi:MoxR-like ATPase
VATGAQIIAMQQLARQVPIASHVGDYVSRLVINSHPAQTSVGLVRDYVRYGASPRAAQALVLAAKIWALFDGRYNVSFDDVSAVAAASLRHRLILNFEGLADAISPDTIIDALLETVPREV